MFRILTLLSCFVIVTFLINPSSTSLLLVDPKNPCRAYGNASVYDITNLVEKWPVAIKGPGFDEREYTYWWSCAGKIKLCSNEDVAICQQRMDETILRFDAGNVSPQLWFGVFNGPAVQVNENFLCVIQILIDFCWKEKSWMGYNVSKSSIRCIARYGHRYSSYSCTFYSWSRYWGTCINNGWWT